MISSLPWSGLVLFRCNFSPYFGVPVKHADWIEALLVRSSSTKNYNLVGHRIVVDSTVRSMSWLLSSCVDFFPDSLSGMVGPEVIHVIRIFMWKEIPAYPPKKRTSSWMAVQVCPQRGHGLFVFLSIFCQFGFSIVVRYRILFYNMLSFSKIKT